MKRTSLKYFLKNEIKDIKITAYREMQIDRLDYLSSMSESESINYKLIFIDFKNFKKINVAWRG
jgi:GGDEF domain-containing protein